MHVKFILPKIAKSVRIGDKRFLYLAKAYTLRTQIDSAKLSHPLPPAQELAQGDRHDGLLDVQCVLETTMDLTETFPASVYTVLCAEFVPFSKHILSLLLKEFPYV
jgi:hypothetical protein